MSRKARRLFFYSLVILFIVAGSSVILYSKGWRIDFETNTLRQTGAIFVRTQPRDAKLLINDEEIERKNGFLLSGTLIKNLIPGDYKLTIQAEGYRKWENVLPVTEEVVTEIKDTILIPESIPQIIKATSTKQFWTNEENEVIFTGNKLIYQDRVLSGDTFIDFTADQYKMITYNGKQAIYLLNNLRERSITNINLMFKNQQQEKGLADDLNIRSVKSNIQNSNEVFITTNRGVYRLNLENRELSMIYKLATVNEIILNGEEVVLPQNNLLISLGVSLEESRTIATMEEKIKQVKPNEGVLVALLDNGSLKTIAGGQVKEIAHSVEKFYADGGMIYFVEKNGYLNIYSQEKDGYRKIKISEPKEILKIYRAGSRQIWVEYKNRLNLLEFADFNISLDNPVLANETIVSEPFTMMAVSHDQPTIQFINKNNELIEISYFSDLIK